LVDDFHYYEPSFSSEEEEKEEAEEEEEEEEVLPPPPPIEEANYCDMQKLPWNLDEQFGPCPKGGILRVNPKLSKINFKGVQLLLEQLWPNPPTQDKWLAWVTSMYRLCVLFPASHHVADKDMVQLIAAHFRQGGGLLVLIHWNSKFQANLNTFVELFRFWSVELSIKTIQLMICEEIASDNHAAARIFFRKFDLERTPDFSCSLLVEHLNLLFLIKMAPTDYNGDVLSPKRLVAFQHKNDLDSTWMEHLEYLEHPYSSILMECDTVKAVISPLPAESSNVGFQCLLHLLYQDLASLQGFWQTTMQGIITCSVQVV